MRLNLRGVTGALLSATILSRPVAGQVRGQPRATDSSIAAIMRRLGPTVNNQPRILSILRTTSVIRARKDSLADSLAAHAIASRVDSSIPDSLGFEPAFRAVGALGRSGMIRYPGMEESEPGQAYAGAFDRLVRIHREAPDWRIRQEALRLMLVTADRARGIAYVRQVAEQRDEASYAAVYSLIQDATGFSQIPEQSAAQRAETSAVLRDLAAKKRVTNPLAAQLLANWVSSQPRSG